MIDSPWPRVPIGEIIDDVLDRRGVTPTKLGSTFTASGHRVISAKLVKSGRLELSADEPRFVDTPTYRRWMKTPLRAGDVIVTSEAPPGEVAYMTDDREWCLGQRLFALRPKSTRVVGRYLAYALQSADVQHDLQSRATGTTVHGVRQPELLRVRLPLPALAEQRAIAGVLGALDDKIELDRHIVETNRELAKLTLQRAALDGVVVRIGDIATVERGLAYTSAGLSNVGIPMINPGNAANFGWLKRSGFKCYAGSHKERHVVGPWGLLVTSVEQTWSNEIMGWPMLVPDDLGQVLFSQDLYAVRFADGEAWRTLPVWAGMHLPASRAWLEGHVYGSTVARIPREAIEGLRVAMPVADSPALRAAEFLLRRAWVAEVESETLAALRDALLQKLLSGELRIPGAERIAEEAEA